MLVDISEISHSKGSEQIVKYDATQGAQGFAILPWIMNQLVNIHESDGYASQKTSKRAIDILNLLTNILEVDGDNMDYLLSHGIKELVIRLLEWNNPDSISYSSEIDTLLNGLVNNLCTFSKVFDIQRDLIDKECSWVLYRFINKID